MEQKAGTAEIVWRFSLSYRVRISDINYGGHVANSALLDFFHEARLAYLARFGYSEMEIGGCGLILPEAHVRYLAEMFHNDELTLRVRVAELRNSAFVMAYQIERNGTVTAEGTTTLVAFDYQKRKARRLPEEFKARVAAYEAGET